MEYWTYSAKWIIDTGVLLFKNLEQAKTNSLKRYLNMGLDLENWGNSTNHYKIYLKR